MTIRHPKLTCAVFGCKRWTRQYPKGWEFMCRVHWQMAPKKLRTLHRKAAKRVRENSNEKNRRLEYRIWRRCVAAADRNVGMPS